MMLRSYFRPLERCFDRVSVGVGNGNDNGNGNGDHLLWHLDLKPHPSGDFSIAVVQANSSLEDQCQVLASPSATYVGVYDGYGGPDASRFVNNRLFPYLRKFASEQGELSADVIRKAFNETEEEFLYLVKRVWPLRPEIASSGSCCLVGAIVEDMIYVANLGDSRAVLGRSGADGRAVAERLTSDHNVAVEEVRKELLERHPDDPDIVVYKDGEWRIKGLIQVSRSIGAVYLKKPAFSDDPLYKQSVPHVQLIRSVLTAEPSIGMRKLKPHDRFLIFASDGLWEQLSDEAAVEMVFENPRAGIAKRLVNAAQIEAAKKMNIWYDDMKRLNKGERRVFHDDITVIVMYLDQHHQAKPSRFGNGNANSYDYTSVPTDISSFNSDASVAPLRPVKRTMNLLRK